MMKKSNQKQFDYNLHIKNVTLKSIISYTMSLNLLSKYIREILKESYLSDKIDKMNISGMKVFITGSPTAKRLFLVNSTGEQVGHLAFEFGPQNWTGKCLDAWRLTDVRMKGEEGFGPVLYDVALELASTEGGGLMADRGAVSQSAQRVWKYYLKNRPDVQHFILDDKRNDPENRITPDDDSDDCRMPVLMPPYGMNKPSKNKPGNPNKKYVNNPLAYVFRATGTPTINALTASGVLVSSA